MTKQSTIVLIIGVFSVAILAGQERAAIPQVPRGKSGPTFEEIHERMSKANQEYFDLMIRQGWQLLLRVTDQQYKIIEPRIDKLLDVFDRATAHTFGATDGAGDYRWDRPSRERGRMSGKTRDQMPEGYRLVEELIDLLEDKTSTDEAIRKKMDELKQAREEGLKELDEVGQELASVLTTAHQEAVLLLLGYID